MPNDEDEIKVADSENATEAAWFFKEQVAVLQKQLATQRMELVAVYGERDFLRTIVSRQASALENWSNR